MSTVRLLEFSCTYAVNNTNDTVELVHGDVSRAIEQMKCRDDAFVPTPVPKRDGSSAERAISSKSSLIQLNDIEQVLPIYLRVYYKDQEKVKRASIEAEVKNNETVYGMLALMLPKLKALKDKTEAIGRMYHTKRKFRSPIELDFLSDAKTVIGDLAETGNSMFFVFDMVGRLDTKETAEEKTPKWVVNLKSSKTKRSI
ncbi:hypothetical protein V3C99_015600 [Haemonchus contortus]